MQSSDSNTSEETCYISLIKYVPSATAWSGDVEQLLIDFYVRGICPGRTVATQSDGYLSLLQTANTCLSTRYAVLSLSASYISEYLPSHKDYYQHAELYYSTQALQALTTQIANGEDHDGALATSMLLMHHGTVNNTPESPLCWSCHANIFDVIPAHLIDHCSAPALFMRSQLLLARTAQTSQALQSTRFHTLETTSWFEGVPPEEAQKISGILGFSPQLLHLVSAITSLAFESNKSNVVMYGQALEGQLLVLKQWTAEAPGPEREVLLATSEAFRLAALIYLRCRLYGMTRFHPSVVEACDTLYALILSLPVQGALYTAIYPVWPLFVAAVTVNSDKRGHLYQRVVPISEGDKNTLPSVLKRVSGMRIWLAQQDPACQRRDGWWDEMLSPSSSTTAPRKNLLCLG